MARTSSSVFPRLNTVYIIYGLMTIVSLLLIKFYHDYARRENGKANAEFGPESAFLVKYSYIEAFQNNLEAAGNEDGLREKELLQFLCALKIIEVEFGKIKQRFGKDEFPSSGNDEESTDVRRIKSSGSSMFASASDVPDWRSYVAPSTPLDETQHIQKFIHHMAIVETLLDYYAEPSKIVYFLRKFGIAFGSVEEMLQKEGDSWFLAKEDLDAVNIFLKTTIGSPVQWKWVRKGKTVFPLVPADKCRAHRQNHWGQDGRRIS